MSLINIILIVLLFNGSKADLTSDVADIFTDVTQIFSWIDNFNIDNLNKLTDHKDDLIDIARKVTPFVTLMDGITNIADNIDDELQDLIGKIPDQITKMKQFIPLLNGMIKINPERILDAFLSGKDKIEDCFENMETSIDIPTLFSPYFNHIPNELNIPFCLFEKLIDTLSDIVTIEIINDRWLEFKSTFISTTQNMDNIKNILVLFRGPKSNYQKDLEECSEVKEYQMEVTLSGIKSLMNMANFMKELLSSIIETIASILEGLGDSSEINLTTFPDVGTFVGKLTTPENWWSIVKGLIKPLDLMPALFEVIQGLTENAIKTVCSESDIIFIEEKAELRSDLREVIDDYDSIKDGLHDMISDYNNYKSRYHVMVDDYISIKNDLRVMINDYNAHKNNKTVMENNYINNINNQTILLNSYVANLINTTIMTNDYVKNIINNTITINDYTKIKDQLHGLLDHYLCNKLNLTRTMDDYVNHNRLYIPNPKPENGDNVCLRN